METFSYGYLNQNNCVECGSEILTCVWYSSCTNPHSKVKDFLVQQLPPVRRSKGRTQVALTEAGCEKDPNNIIGPPTTLISKIIYRPDHPSKEGKRLKPDVLGVKAKPVDRPEPPG
ncbi:hypothetical protein AVEN_41044-1 [Araneus ventricosus]|uniref:Uncharacterized protein n=1 Tax=Araneus ventricosus TaxID=182803 RepID=A0A4Y2CIQ6_ARAVE|nr:hypothetical protein AVEN_41044-1 [Araneus ventricosus]